MDSLPSWAEAFNSQKLPAKYVERKWDGFPKWDFHASGSHAAFSELPASPWGNELIEQFAEKAVDGEKLGQRAGITDLLTVSFSSNDYVGHAVGPDAPEVRDMSIRTDALLAKFFQLLDKKVGMANVIVVLSADHGVAQSPEVARKDKMPSGYITTDPAESVTAALNKQFGKANWLIGGGGETSLYLDAGALASRQVAERDVYRVAREALLADPHLHVARVYSRDQLESGVAGDFIGQAETNGFFPKRSGDLMIVFEPGWVPGHSGTSHFSPYAYDRHVPMLFMGPGIKAGRYDGTVQPNDIAPTLATMLNIQTPSGSSGRVLSEMIAR